MFSFLGCVRYNEDFVKSKLVSYIEVLFHTFYFYCNFGGVEGNHSLYRVLRYIVVRSTVFLRKLFEGS